MNKRRRYSEEFKEDAVRKALKAEEPMKVIAVQLGVSDWTLRRWVKERGIVKDASGISSQGSSRTSVTQAEWEEIKRLRKEVRQLRLEREILEKATAFFAKKKY
jgi:transposase